MDIIKPNEFGFTIYSKSGCPNCLKVKALLKKNNINFIIVDCDVYLIEDKSFFLVVIMKQKFILINFYHLKILLFNF